MLFKFKSQRLKFKTSLKLSKIILAAVAFMCTAYFILNTVHAEIDCQNTSPGGMSAGDAEFCANQLQNIINAYLPAQDANKKSLAVLQSQLNDINKRVNALTAQITQLTKSIKSREADAAYTKEILDQKARGQYMYLRLYDPITPFIFSDTASKAFRELTLRQRAADSDRETIERYVQELTKLKNDEASLQKTKDSLAVSQKQLSEKTNFLASEVAKVDAYLATLSAKQQAFIAAKLESLGLSRSAYNMKGGCSSDINPYKDPGFSGTKYAFFTYGVPNRVGMNQFGAKGRAEAGQSAETILKAYYNADYTTGFNQSINIKVSGTNEFGQSFNETWNIDEYLKHLYEMPIGDDWPMEALKAQAIAARSYALAYTNNGSGSICPSQKCQVVKKELNGLRWQQAVDDTKGIVMTSGGAPIKAWSSSTHGGYAYTSADIGWSGTSWTKRLVDATGAVNNFSYLMNSAYDKSSPIFYCDWGSYHNKTAWLKSEEVADIVNAVLLAQKDGTTKSHLYQTDKPNPEGTDTWDAATVKSKLGGDAINSIESISVSVDFSTGRTTSVNVNGRSINGDDFKNYFNLRAPSNIQIVGPLFNVEIR